MSWSIRGEYFENSNCEILCPCITSSLAGPADNERCYVLLICHIEAGEPRIMEFEVEGIYAPDSDKVMEITNTIHPMGSNLPIARGVVGRYDDADYGFSFDNTGKNGHFREFAWAA
ncbi:MAG: hypothetical protein ABI927_06335 [Gaiellaceae bacterium]